MTLQISMSLTFMKLIFCHLFEQMKRLNLMTFAEKVNDGNYQKRLINDCP